MISYMAHKTIYALKEKKASRKNAVYNIVKIQQKTDVMTLVIFIQKPFGKRLTM